MYSNRSLCTFKIYLLELEWVSKEWSTIWKCLRHSYIRSYVCTVCVCRNAMGYDIWYNKIKYNTRRGAEMNLLAKILDGLEVKYLYIDFCGRDGCWFACFCLSLPSLCCFAFFIIVIFFFFENKLLCYVNDINIYIFLQREPEMRGRRRNIVCVFVYEEYSIWYYYCEDFLLSIICISCWMCILLETKNNRIQCLCGWMGDGDDGMKWTDGVWIYGCNLL